MSMENSFFVMGGKKGNPIKITRLQLCTWNIISENACMEIGIEIAPSSLQENERYTISFFAEWLDETCSFISLHNKFADHGNIRFIFNETSFSTRPIEGYTHNGTIVTFDGSNRALTVLPVETASPQQGWLTMSFKNQARNGEAPYLRVLIKSGRRNLAMIKKGIAKNTYVFDIKINERRNLPPWVLDIMREKDLCYCLIERVFCLHAIPASFEIGFIDGNKLKGVRELERNAFEKYLPEIKSLKTDDYIITFSKDANVDNGSSSFFSVFTQETIGIPQVIFAVAANIVCSLLFAFAGLRTGWNPQLSWYRQIPIEFWGAIFLLVSVFIYVLHKRGETK